MPTSLGVGFRGNDDRVDMYRCLSRACLELNNMLKSKRSAAAALHCFPANLEAWCDVAAILHETSIRLAGADRSVMVSSRIAHVASTHDRIDGQPECPAALNLSNWVLICSEQGKRGISPHSKRRALKFIQHKAQ